MRSHEPAPRRWRFLGSSLTGWAMIAVVVAATAWFLGVLVVLRLFVKVCP